MVGFPELTEEVRLVVEASAVKYLHDAELCADEQAGGVTEPGEADEFAGRHAGKGFDLAVELHFTEVAGFFQPERI